MRKLYWWDDDDRETPIRPRHSKSLVSNRNKHRVNDLRRMAEEQPHSVSFPQEPQEALVYA